MYMDKKNNKLKRTFIPQTIGNVVNKINRNFTSKYGRLEFVIQSNWSKIVGSYFDNFSEPKNITRVTDHENDLGEKVYRSYLQVNVTPAAALEFQHFKDKIIENINSYFGYKAIMDLRINQNYKPKYDKINKLNSNEKIISQNDKKIIKNEVINMENIDLKKSLINLGISITKGSK